MTVTAYWQNYNSGGAVPVFLSSNILTVAVRMRLPNAGMFVIWGTATVTNEITTAPVTVSMTTLDGATTLATTTFELGGATGTCVPVQSTLDLSQPTADEVVDIRCSAMNGTVTAASLIAIPVDALSHAAAPPPS